MAGSLNKVTLLGNLGKDPEVRCTQAGNPWVCFSMATSEKWKDKNTGEDKERTQWHNVVIWNEGLCRVAEQYLRKGSKVYIEGQMETRKWQDQQGQDRYTTEVVLRPFNGTLILLGDPGGNRAGVGGHDREYDGPTQQPRTATSTDNSRAREYGGHSGGRFGDMNDEIPF